MPEFDMIKPGLAGVRDLTVVEDLIVSHTGTMVLSTPRMISLMESLSMQLVHPLLPAGYTTVGYEVHVRHKAPARLGALIRVSSRLLEADGRKLLFEVQVSENGKVIGEGLHRRTIISVSG